MSSRKVIWELGQTRQLDDRQPSDRQTPQKPVVGYGGTDQIHRGSEYENGNQRVGAPGWAPSPLK